MYMRNPRRTSCTQDVQYVCRIQCTKYDVQCVVHKITQDVQDVYPNSHGSQKMLALSDHKSVFLIIKEYKHISKQSSFNQFA